MKVIWEVTLPVKSVLAGQDQVNLGRELQFLEAGGSNDTVDL